jgi:hypothetical protein
MATPDGLVNAGKRRGARDFDYFFQRRERDGNRSGGAETRARIETRGGFVFHDEEVMVVFMNTIGLFFVFGLVERRARRR